MSLKGKGTRKPVPYIPELERSSDVPTIFWIRPKNMKGTYVSLDLYQKGSDVTGRGQRTINPNKMMEADIKDFIGFCERVQNYQFSEDYAELAAKGVIAEIADPAELRMIVLDMDPAVFQEIQNVSADWDRLGAGEEAYKTWTQFNKTQIKPKQ